MNEALSVSPRSGRTKIAQRFIAGISSSLTIAAREAGDRLLGKSRDLRRSFSVARSTGSALLSADDPSTESAELLSIVRSADSARTAFMNNAARRPLRRRTYWRAPNSRRPLMSGCFQGLRREYAPREGRV